MPPGEMPAVGNVLLPLLALSSLALQEGSPQNLWEEEAGLWVALRGPARSIFVHKYLKGEDFVYLAVWEK